MTAYTPYMARIAMIDITPVPTATPDYEVCIRAHYCLDDLRPYRVVTLVEQDVESSIDLYWLIREGLIEPQIPRIRRTNRG